MSFLWPPASEHLELGDDEIHVWGVELTPADDEDREMLAILSADERQRASQIGQQAAHSRFIRSRGALRSLLGRYLGISPREIRLAYRPGGKPYLAVEPPRRLPPRSIDFNLSHSGELGLIAVSAIGDVGIDVEKLRPIRNLEQLAARNFHQDETAAVLADADSTDAAFLRCWTRKEALLKAIGTGIHAPLDRFCVPTEEHVAQFVEIETWKAYPSSRWWLASLEPATGYTAAVASPVPPGKMVFHGIR